MLSILLTIFIVYLAVSLFGYLVHKALHQSWTGRFNSSHMAHHVTLYPPQDYLSDKYRDAGKDDTFWIFAALSLPLLAIPILLWLFGLISVILTGLALAEMLFIGWLNTYLHMAFHIRNHFLYRIPIIKIIFNKWNDFHYLHHVDMQTNFGIFNFKWDRLFGTFWKG
jgi:sterol desaturase/sphingolipid hydroxylase (fatty acid hydroxylase superfamily)